MGQSTCLNIGFYWPQISDNPEPCVYSSLLYFCSIPVFVLINFIICSFWLNKGWINENKYICSSIFWSSPMLCEILGWLHRPELWLFHVVHTVCVVKDTIKEKKDNILLLVSPNRHQFSPTQPRGSQIFWYFSDDLTRILYKEIYIYFLALIIHLDDLSMNLPGFLFWVTLKLGNQVMITKKRHC